MGYDVASLCEFIPRFGEGGNIFLRSTCPLKMKAMYFFYWSGQAHIKTQDYISEDGDIVWFVIGSANIYKHILFGFPNFLFLVLVYYVIYIYVCPSSF
jgi:hypothetical protein